MIILVFIIHRKNYKLVNFLKSQKSLISQIKNADYSDKVPTKSEPFLKSLDGNTKMRRRDVEKR